jgi:hypothetical protein
MLEEAPGAVKRPAVAVAEIAFPALIEKRVAVAAAPRKLEAIIAAVSASSSEMSKHPISPIVFRYIFDISFRISDFNVSIYLFYIFSLEGEGGRVSGSWNQLQDAIGW